MIEDSLYLDYLDQVDCKQTSTYRLSLYDHAETYTLVFLLCILWRMSNRLQQSFR